MLSHVLSALRCPVCPAADEEPLTSDGAVLRCAHAHSFDIARQGYVNLAVRHPGTADSGSMVRARQAWLDRGHYAPLSTRIAELAADRTPKLVVDVGAGTGHYLAATLQSAPSAVGLAIDLSTHAVRRAAKKHHRIGAVAADVWGSLPVRTNAAEVLLDLFAPRNGEEFARILRPGGTLLVATPRADHLAELRSSLSLLWVDQDKQSRLSSTLDQWFSLSQTESVEFPLSLTRSEAADAIAMGPNAWHLGQQEIEARLTRLAEPIVVTAAIDVSRWTRR